MLRDRPFPLGRMVLILLLMLGVFFRGVNLDRKVFWVDEVATALRVAGYTRSEMAEILAQKPSISVAALRNYQKITPTRNFGATLSALSKSPEHAPLYFVLARLWTQVFGSSIVALRSLSVLFSGLGMGCFVWLTWELFQTASAAAIALALISVSPFFVAYAQEARPYSLWGVTLLLSSATLLRAHRLDSKSWWTLHSMTLIVNFYTSLLSLLVWVGQATFVGIQQREQGTGRLKNYGRAVAIALIAFIPWLLVIAHHQQQLQTNTNWMRESMNGWAMVAVWIYSLLIPFADFPVSTELSPLLLMGLLVSVGLLILMGISFHALWRTAPPSSRLFVVLFTATTPLILMLVDLSWGGQASATSRYLIPSQLGVLLAIAAFLSGRMTPQKPLWKIVLLGILAVQVGSCIQNVDQSPMYQKSRNSHNEAIATLIQEQACPAAVQPPGSQDTRCLPEVKVWAEPQDAMDLLSLSHNLNPALEIQLLSHPQQLMGNVCPALLFNPSAQTLQALNADQQYTLTELYQPKLLTSSDAHLTLWSIRSTLPFSSSVDQPSCSSN